MKVFCNIKNGFSVAEAMVVLLITSLALAAASPLISRTLKSDGLDMLLQKKNEEKIKDLDNKLSNLENKVGVLENNVSEIRNQINTMNNNISSVTNNVNSLKNNITSMTNSINNVSSSLSDLEKKLSDLDTIPSGSVVFFNLSYCPSGWRAVPSTWNNKFFRVQQGSGRSVGSAQDFAMQDVTISGQFSGVSVSATAGGAFSLGAKSYLGVGQNSKTYASNSPLVKFSYSLSKGGAKTASETRPANIALVACIKN